MAERRRSLRKKSFLRGCVYFNKRRSAIDCLIRDISDQGARIIFSGTTNFPTLSSFTFRTRNRPSAPTSSGVVAMKWAWPFPTPPPPRPRWRARSRNSAIWRNGSRNLRRRWPDCGGRSSS